MPFVREKSSLTVRQFFGQVARPRRWNDRIGFSLPKMDIFLDILQLKAPILHQNLCVVCVSKALDANILFPDCL